MKGSNQKINGEFDKHVRRKMKKLTSKKRRAIAKNILTTQTNSHE